MDVTKFAFVGNWIYYGLRCNFGYNNSNIGFGYQQQIRSMAGHSKWKTIKSRKEAQDSKMQQAISRHLRSIRNAVSSAKSGDPVLNSKLASAMDRASAARVPKHLVQNAIKTALGTGKDSVAFDEQVYEGSGPGGSLILVLAETDNKMRTAKNVRHIFSKYGGNLGATNSSLFAFDQVGHIVVGSPLNDDTNSVEQKPLDIEKIMEAAIDGGALDVEISEDEKAVDVYCQPNETKTLSKHMISSGFNPLGAELTYKAKMFADIVSGSVEHEEMDILLEKLEALDDVNDVIHNAQIIEEKS